MSKVEELDNQLDAIIDQFHKGTAERKAVTTLQGLMVRAVLAGARNEPVLPDDLLAHIAEHSENPVLHSALKETAAVFGALIIEALAEEQVTCAV